MLFKASSVMVRNPVAWISLLLCLVVAGRGLLCVLTDRLVVSGSLTTPLVVLTHHSAFALLYCCLASVLRAVSL